MISKMEFRTNAEIDEAGYAFDVQSDRIDITMESVTRHEKSIIYNENLDVFIKASIRCSGEEDSTKLFESIVVDHMNDYYYNIEHIKDTIYEVDSYDIEWWGYGYILPIESTGREPMPLDFYENTFGYIATTTYNIIKKEVENNPTNLILPKLLNNFESKYSRYFIK